MFTRTPGQPVLAVIHHGINVRQVRGVYVRTDRGLRGDWIVVREGEAEVKVRPANVQDAA